MSITKVLTECPLFNGFDNDEIERILSSVPFRIENYPAKEIYTLAGAPCKYADFILEGEMTARMVETSGKLVQIDRLKPGTLIAPAFIFTQKKKYACQRRDKQANNDIALTSIRTKTTNGQQRTN